MAITILNELLSDDEFTAIKQQVGASEIIKWPAGDFLIPAGTTVVILVVREDSTQFEEARALQVVKKGLRVVCIRLQDFSRVSIVAEMICTTNVSLDGGAVESAIAGIEDVQKAATGSDLPVPKRERNPCR